MNVKIGQDVEELDERIGGITEEDSETVKAQAAPEVFLVQDINEGRIAGSWVVRSLAKVKEIMAEIDYDGQEDEDYHLRVERLTLNDTFLEFVHEDTKIGRNNGDLLRGYNRNGAWIDALDGAEGVIEEQDDEDEEELIAL